MIVPFVDSDTPEGDEDCSGARPRDCGPAAETGSFCDGELLRFLPLIAKKLTWQETVALETKVYDRVDPHALFLKIKQRLGVSIDVRCAGLKTVAVAMLRNEQKN